MKYLLDTCVLSELVKPVPEPAVARWMLQQTESMLFTSALTLAELQRGVARLAASRRKTQLETWLRDVENTFDKRIIAFTHHTAPYWASLCAKAQSGGQTLALIDSLIAASALEHGLVLVTRNVADFAHAPILVLNPWKEPT